MLWLYTWLHTYITGYLESIAIRAFVTGPFIVCVSLTLLAIVDTPALIQTYRWIVFLFPLWGPLFVVPTFWYFWMNFIRSAFIAKQKNVVFEIKLPKEIKQSPKAMERVFASFHIRSGQTTWLTRNWKGGVGTWWSFEMHSYEGKIRFYVWCRKGIAPLVQQFIYAQYPEVQVVEVQDYLSGLHYVPGRMNVWAVEYGLLKPDAYPIKTYIDYQLDNLDSGRNGEKYSDPLTSIFERFADIRKGEQAVLQIVIAQVRAKSTTSKWHWLHWGDRWYKDSVKKEIKKIYEGARLDYENTVTGDIEKGFAQLKPAEQEIVKALERSLDKHAYEVNIRVARFGRPGEYRGSINSHQFTQMWRQFTAGKFNGINTLGMYWQEHYDFVWQDFFGIRTARWNRNIFDFMRRRGGFYDPYMHPHYVFTTEELATIYHFPDQNSQVPGIEYLSSRTSEAPFNLPT